MYKNERFGFLSVDGLWTEWDSWEDCTVSCGGGTKTKTRSCSDPESQYGGSECVGNGIETEICNNQHCPGKLSKHNSFVLFAGLDIDHLSLKNILNNYHFNANYFENNIISE